MCCDVCCLVQVFLGIGFILTFLRDYSLAALACNLLCGGLAIQWFILGN